MADTSDQAYVASFPWLLFVGASIAVITLVIAWRLRLSRFARASLILLGGLLALYAYGFWPRGAVWDWPFWTTVTSLIGLLAALMIYKALFDKWPSAARLDNHPAHRASLLEASPFPPPQSPEDRSDPASHLSPSMNSFVKEESLWPNRGELQSSRLASSTAPAIPARASPENRIFISYSSRDESRARAFVAELETAGLTCWYAGRDITPGARGYHSRILEAINGSWLVVVLCSRNSVESSHVANELEHATGLKRPMLPVLLEGFDPTELGDLCYFLKRFQMVRLPAPPGTVSRLAAGIADELGINS